jgi:hypothetical protein
VNITISKFNCGDISNTVKELYDLGIRKFLLINVITEEKDILPNIRILKEQINKLTVENLEGATLTLRGFSANLLPQTINKDSKNIKVELENHNFKTLVPINQGSKDYFNKMNSLFKNEKK